MPLSPPASPTVGQTYTANGRTWSWTGTAWELVAASGGSTDSRWDLFLPASPTGLTVTGGNAQASLSWTAPTGVIAQAPVTDYREQYSTDGGTTWTTFTAAASTATSATVTGLTNGTAYRFRVAAVNGVGTGAYTSASSSVTPSAVLFSAIAAGWSGTGTAADKLVAPQSPTDFLGGTFGNALFTAGVAGTVRVTGTNHDGNDGDEGRILKNGTTIFSGQTADVSVSVVANDVIRVYMVYGGGRWNPNTRVWLVPS